jgi:hypothetical protein
VPRVIEKPDQTKRPEELSDIDYMLALISKVYMLLVTRKDKTPERAREIIERALNRGEFDGKKKDKFQQLLDDLAQANPNSGG